MFQTNKLPPTHPITIKSELWHQTNALIGIPTLTFFKGFGTILWGWVSKILTFPAKSPTTTKDPSLFKLRPQLVI